MPLTEGPAVALVDSSSAPYSHFDYVNPQAGPNYRARAVELGGKSRFPFLVDPNTGRSMYESADIIQYLFDT